MPRGLVVRDQLDCTLAPEPCVLPPVPAFHCLLLPREQAVVPRPRHPFGQESSRTCALVPNLEPSIEHEMVTIRRHRQRRRRADAMHLQESAHTEALVEEDGIRIGKYGRLDVRVGQRLAHGQQLARRRMQASTHRLVKRKRPEAVTVPLSIGTIDASSRVDVLQGLRPAVVGHHDHRRGRLGRASSMAPCCGGAARAGRRQCAAEGGNRHGRDCAK